MRNNYGKEIPGEKYMLIENVFGKTFCRGITRNGKHFELKITTREVGNINEDILYEKLPKKINDAEGVTRCYRKTKAK